MNEKKSIVIINAVPYGSTGRISKTISSVFEKNNYKVFLAFGWAKNRPNMPQCNRKGWFLSKLLHMALSFFTGLDGFFSYFDTACLIRQIKKINPSCINLHIIHSWFINIPLLFKYIKKNHIPVIWTFHDCWAFTGHCPFFSYENCQKWIDGCFSCQLYKSYPRSLFDNSKKMWLKKKNIFTSVNNMTIVTPSKWLANLVKKSFFNQCCIEVVHNGVDLSVFCPRHSNFRETIGCKDKYIILGVSIDWSKRKGVDSFIWLSHNLPSNFQIVLIGTNDKIDKILPHNIISIHRTDSATKLAEIYSSSDVFVNPTLDDNLPTVNLEAIACGTPVVSYRTGGALETFDSSCGVSVEQGNRTELMSAIINICNNRTISKEACLLFSKKFDINHVFDSYVKIAHSIIEK